MGGQIPDLDCVLHVGGLVDAAFADRVGADADGLLHHVPIAELDVLAVQLLPEHKGELS